MQPNLELAPIRVPTPDAPMRIGARGSPLSLAQTGWLRARLAQALGLGAGEVETRLPIVAITTTGDRIQDRTLMEAGGKGLFTKELDEALLDGRIDCAIHSMKDVPTTVPAGLALLAVPAREDSRDALITLDGRSLDALPDGARIGTASLRRGAQLRHARPDLQVATLRGNVGTRLQRLKDGAFDATVLAVAGMARLGLLHQPHVSLDPVQMPPAIGQGALAVTARAGDAGIAASFALLAHGPTGVCIAAERAFLTALDGSCRTAIGMHARFAGTGLLLSGEALAPDGSQRVRVERRLDAPDAASAAAAGAEMGLEARAMAAGRFRFEGSA